MDTKIYKGTTLLDIQGRYQEGKVYIPSEALDSFVGLWKKDTVFLNSPLAGKRICTTVLSPATYTNGLPPALDYFLALCSAAGANIIYHDGGKFPAGDIILAIEPGGTHTYVNYLGAAFRSKPLSRRIASKIKRGLKLAYLPDPVPFNKPQFNLKLSLGARLFTPAVAVQWPDNLDLGPWLFTSLMEHFGGGEDMEGHQFAMPIPARLESNPPVVLAPEPVPVEEEGIKPPARTIKANLPEEKTKTELRETPGHSASMSRAMYPDFFAQFDKRPRMITKEPFT